MCGSKNGSIKILLPDDILKNISHLMYKTTILGIIARFCSIYKVKEIIIYDSGETWKQKGYDLEIIQDVMNYLATPQYLRKKIFFKKKTLAYVGILPPLNTPNHPPEVKKDDEIFQEDDLTYRIGRIEKIIDGTAWIDIGLNKEYPLEYKNDEKIHQLVNVMVRKTGNEISCKFIEEKEIPLYWGYKIIINREDFNALILRLKKFHFLIATSKYGEDYRYLIKKMGDKIDLARENSIVIFGPRSGGLGRFFRTLNEMREHFDVLVNLFPDSGTKSVRLEEAIPIGFLFYELKKEKD